MWARNQHYKLCICVNGSAKLLVRWPLINTDIPIMYVGKIAAVYLHAMTCHWFVFVECSRCQQNGRSRREDNWNSHRETSWSLRYSEQILVRLHWSCKYTTLPYTRQWSNGIYMYQIHKMCMSKVIFSHVKYKILVQTNHSGLKISSYSRFCIASKLSSISDNCVRESTVLLSGKNPN